MRAANNIINSLSPHSLYNHTSFGLTATTAALKSDSSSSTTTINKNNNDNNDNNDNTTPNNSPNSYPGGLSTTSLAPVVTNIERERLKLIAHYTQHTAQSITDFGVQTGDASLWRDWVVELAFEHDFLLYGLLGLSALHLALQCDNDDSTQKQHYYTILAIQHYDRGIALFRPYLNDIDSASQDALFGFSVIVALYSFGIQRVPPFLTTSSSSIARLHQALSLLRSSSHIAKKDFEALQRGRWSGMLVPLPDTSYKLPRAMEDMLATLGQFTSKTITTSTQQEMYTTCIEALRINLALAVEYDRAQVRVSYLAVATPDELWSMMCIGEPLALAILANFAVVLHWLRHSIWLQGWGRETVEAVREALPVEWHECIAWAVQETNL